MVEVGAADVEVVRIVVVVVAVAPFILATAIEERRQVWWQRLRKFKSALIEGVVQKAAALTRCGSRGDDCRWSESRKDGRVEG